MLAHFLHTAWALPVSRYIVAAKFTKKEKESTTKKGQRVSGGDSAREQNNAKARITAPILAPLLPLALPARPVKHPVNRRTGNGSVRLLARMAL